MELSASPPSAEAFANSSCACGVQVGVEVDIIRGSEQVFMKKVESWIAIG